MNDNLKLVCQDYCRKFERLKVNISTSDLRKLVAKETLKAEKNYHGLAEPRTCSLDTYVALWMREALDREFILKTLKKIDPQNPQDAFAQSITSFFSYLPPKLVPRLRREIFRAPFSERENIWKSFNLPLDEIEIKFQDLIKERIKDVSKRNRSPFFEVFLEKNKIPQEIYDEFVDGIDKLIANLNHQLPQVKNLPSRFYSEFNSPCFICRLSEFPFSSTDEAVGLVAKEYPVLNEFKQKVKIKFTSDRKTYTVYRVKEDVVEVNIGRKINIRHRAIALIHELCHAVSLLNSFKKGEDTIFTGKYEAEKRAIEIEIKLFKKVSKSLLQAIMGEILLSPFRKTLFEIELYQNPDSDVSKLYAESFNRCFLKVKQKDNPLYLLDEKIIDAPFALLPHAIAHYQGLKRETE